MLLRHFLKCRLPFETLTHVYVYQEVSTQCTLHTKLYCAYVNERFGALRFIFNPKHIGVLGATGFVRGAIIDIDIY